MAKAKILQIADDLVDKLNEYGGWQVAFKPASRTLAPVSELEKVDSVTVTVTPSGVRVAADNRSDWAHDYDIDVGIQHKASDKQSKGNPAWDDCLLLAEQIADYWKTNRPESADVPLMAVAYGGPAGLPYFPDHITNLHQFTSVVRLTFREWRS